MELVKLKMKKSYKSFLILTALLIILSGTVGVLYLFYDNIKSDGSFIDVNGSLSINYIDGKNISVDKKESLKLSITNNDEKVHYYNISFYKVRGTGTYRLLDGDVLVMAGELKSTDEIVTDNIRIEELETKTYTLEITNTSDSTLKGSIKLKNAVKTNNFADVILSNNEIKEASITKVGVEVALENEGLIKSSDDLGLSYYFRGNVNNNYVKLGNLVFRIVRINGDGTVRLVLRDATDSVAKYYDTNSEDFSFDNSYMKSYLNTWFENNLSSYEKYIATSKFCNDISHDDAYNYNASTRILINKIPTLNCLGEVVSANVGLMTIDEVMLAGGTPTDTNQKYYLYNSTISNPWYTMSAYKGNGGDLYMFMISSGKVNTNVASNLFRDVRPVINLIKNVEMIGDGTIDNPYRLS